MNVENTENTDVDTPQDDGNEDFDSGFTNAEATTPPPQAQDNPAEEAEVTATPEPEPPKLAQVTEEQFQQLLSKASEIDQIKADSKRQIDTLAGHLGGMKQLVDRLQTQRQQLTPGKLTRLAAEFPELGKLLEEDLGEALGAGQGIDPGEIDKRAQAIVSAELPKLVVQMETKLLRLQHRDWVDVVRSPEFKAWELTLPPAEQAELKSSNDGEFIADKITQFKGTKTSKAPAPGASRQRRLEAAVTPRGTGGHATASTDEDEFNSGFKTG